MSTADGQPQQIKQYKDFTTITSIRKVVQQVMAPTIKTYLAPYQRLQMQLSGILSQYQDFNRKLTRMDDMFKNQANIQKRIDDTNKFINDHKEQQMQKRKQDERRSGRLDTANEKLFIELHSVKKKVQQQDEAIQLITTKTNKTNDMYSNLSSTNQKTLKQVQQKFSSFTKDLLDMSKDITSEHNQIQHQISQVRETFRMQRQALQQKAKPLQLYMSERQNMNDKFNDIYNKILSNVTKQDFQGYRKSQNSSLKQKLQQIQSRVNKILPDSVKKILPTLQKKMDEIDKIKHIQEYCTKLENSLKQSGKSYSQMQKLFHQKIQKINNIIKQQNNKIQQMLSQKIVQLSQGQQNLMQIMEQKIKQMKNQIEENLQNVIEKQTQELQKTIQAQAMVNNTKRKTQVNQDLNIISPAKAQEILAQVQTIREIKQKIIGRYNKIEEISRQIQHKIQSYSNRITRIKSDYELFAENMRRQMSGVIKFRDTFLERLMDIGGLLSTFAQALLINTSFLIQNKQQTSCQIHQKGQNKQKINYVTQNDGIIYEWKPQSSPGIIQYRKQKLEMKQFLLSYMYSLTTFIDDQFANLSFLNWNDQKPSDFFHHRLLPNYHTCVKRSVESRSSYRQINSSNKHRRVSVNSSNQISQNQNIWMQSEMDLQNTGDPTASTKQFSKTIQEKALLQKTLEEGYFANMNMEINKNYSIKRQKPMSGRSKSKRKEDSNEAERYQKIFLTSRSACRSRLSQAM